MVDYTIRDTTRGKRSKRMALFFLFICIVLFCSGAILYNQFKIKISRPAPLSPLAMSTPTPLPKDSGLGNAVAQALSGTQGSYAIDIINLTTGETYGLNDHTVYKSGSLYKLWIMATVYKKIQDGSLHKDDVLSEGYSTLNTLFQIDPDDADQTDGTLTLSVGDALYQMITISDNYAALLLTENVKLSTVATFLKNTGLNESKVGANGNDPTTTAHDVALFFEKLYQGSLANAEYTEEMLDLLKQQKLNTKIPKYLPDSIVVAHKTGELDSYTHDAGIIYTPSGNYILVVLSNSEDTDAANERISEVSKNVYNYFSQQ